MDEFELDDLIAEIKADLDTIPEDLEDDKATVLDTIENIIGKLEQIRAEVNADKEDSLLDSRQDEEDAEDE